MTRWYTRKVLKQSDPTQREIEVCLLDKPIDRIILRLLKIEFGGIGKFRTKNFGYGLPFGILIFTRKGPGKDTRV